MATMIYGATELLGELIPPPDGHQLVGCRWRLQDLATGEYVAEGDAVTAEVAVAMMNTAASDWKRAAA